jgi:hypothetical protein
MKLRLNIIMYIFLIIVFSYTGIQSLEKMGTIQSLTASGKYVPGDIISVTNIKFLPIPAGTNDYIFYQSIKKVSNIVIGKFKTGEREILLIQDDNADGKVNLVAHWAMDLNRIDREGEPEIFCSAENFKKLKEAVVNGRSETILLGGKNYTVSPNKNGMSDIEKLLNVPSNITKYKQGLRIKKIDPDELSKEMMVFSFSYNSENNTADMAFDIKYYYSGKERISPIINQGVYCLQSEDPFVIETVKKLRETSAKYLPK